MSDITDDLVKIFFIDFMTNPQKYNLGESNFDVFIGHIIYQINSSKEFSAYYDSFDFNLLITKKDEESKPVLKVEFEQEKKEYIVLSPFDEKAMKEQSTIKAMGSAAICMMNAYTSWEIEELPKYIKEEARSKHINIFLSEVDVTLDEKEKEVIEGILKKMAEAKNYRYEALQKIAFEIELRASYPEGASKAGKASDLIDFEWV